MSVMWAVMAMCVNMIVEAARGDTTHLETVPVLPDSISCFLAAAGTLFFAFGRLHAQFPNHHRTYQFSVCPSLRVSIHAACAHRRVASGLAGGAAWHEAAAQDVLGERRRLQLRGACALPAHQ